jgi:hypothetical protein
MSTSSITAAFKTDVLYQSGYFNVYLYSDEETILSFFIHIYLFLNSNPEFELGFSQLNARRLDESQD